MLWTALEFLGPGVLGIAAAPLAFIRSDAVKQWLPFIFVGIISAFLGWKLCDWLLVSRVETALEKTQTELATAKINVETLQEAVKRQNQQISNLATEAERITSARSDEAVRVLRNARPPKRETIKGVKQWNATVAD